MSTTNGARPEPLTIDVREVACRSFGLFGGSPSILATIDGIDYILVRQAGLGIWAFRNRHKLTSGQCAALDRTLNAAYLAEQEKRSLR